MMKTEGNTLMKDVRRRKRLRLLAINGLAFAGAIILFVLLGFVGKKQHDAVCWKLDVEVQATDEKKYIDEALILRIANSSTDQIVGKPVDEIDISAIHSKLSENSSVREAHVYTTVDGRCVIKVLQRTPLARIFTAQGHSFYLDKDGFTMALSDHYSAKVPVFTGHINEQMSTTSILDRSGDAVFNEATVLDDIYKLTQFINKNEFWSAMVEHVYVNADGEFEIIPRVGNHHIRIGNTENLEEKFKKLLAFYANTLHTRDLNTYSTINVKYDGQVVCVKR
jgi:cell division protein FtsQ